MLVITATQEAEISRILVQSQPGQIYHKTLTPNTHHKKGCTKKKCEKPNILPEPSKLDLSTSSSLVLL
jgi:hypothetical protein